MGSVSFTIPLRTTTGAGNSREHHHAKARRTTRERQAVVAAWPRELWVQLPLLVKLARVSPGKADPDNAIAGMKAVQDAIARQLGVDDGDARWVQWEYLPPRRGAWAVEVELLEAPLGPGQDRRPAIPRPPECPQCLGAKKGDGQVHCAGRQRAHGCRCWCAKSKPRKRQALRGLSLAARAGLKARLHLPGCVRGGACQPGCPGKES